MRNIRHIFNKTLFYGDLSKEEILLFREEAYPQFHKNVKDKYNLLLASGFCLVHLMSVR